MKKSMQGAVILALINALTIPSALAHAGHDHSHWSSSLLHAFFYISMFSAAGICAYAGYKAIYRKKTRAQ